MLSRNLLNCKIIEILLIYFNFFMCIVRYIKWKLSWQSIIIFIYFFVALVLFYSSFHIYNFTGFFKFISSWSFQGCLFMAISNNNLFNINLYFSSTWSRDRIGDIKFSAQYSTARPS